MRRLIANYLRRLLDRLGSTSADIAYGYADGHVTVEIVVDGVTYKESNRLDVLLEMLGLPGDPVAAIRKTTSFMQLNELDARCKMQARALREALKEIDKLKKAAAEAQADTTAGITMRDAIIDVLKKELDWSEKSQVKTPKDYREGFISGLKQSISIVDSSLFKFEEEAEAR